MTFTEDWFGDSSCQVLAGEAQRIADVPGRIIEIGSWEGRSTVALANAVHPRAVQAVDTWRGSPGEISADLAAGRDVYHTFRANVRKLTGGNVIPHRMDWREYAAEGWADRPIALLFIDAEHTFTEVYDTITTFLPHLAEGGTICGDDRHHPPVQEAVHAAFPGETIIGNATLWIRRS